MEIFKCNYCGKEKKIKNKYTISGHLSRCVKWKQYKTCLSKEILYQKYITEKKSMPEIANDFSVGTAVIYNKLREFNIPIRSLKETSLSKERKIKIENTHLSRYGVRHNFCKDSPSRIAWQKRLLEEEGITNVFQREEVKQKSLKTLLEKYQVEKAYELSIPVRGKNVFSSVHRSIVAFLNEVNCDTTIEFKIPKNDISFFSYDICITGTHKLIEVYGDYWHGNPLSYIEDDIVLKGSSKEKRVSQIWSYDIKKINFAIDKGYQVLIIWEYDWKNNKNQIIKRISNYVKESKN